jgi:hypothetical protein
MRKVIATNGVPFLLAANARALFFLMAFCLVISSVKSQSKFDPIADNLIGKSLLHQYVISEFGKTGDKRVVKGVNVTDRAQNKFSGQKCRIGCEL